MRGRSLRSGTEPRGRGFEAHLPRRFPVTDLSHAHVLIVAPDGFEQAELLEPRQALLDAGAKVTLASLSTDPIQGMKHDEKGDTITPDLTIDDVDTEDYTALLLPGGVANPDALRMN